MKCITCGNELLEGDCICSQCGSYIESTHTDNPSDNSSAYDSPYQSTTSEDSDSYQNPYANMTGTQYTDKVASVDKSSSGTSFLESPLICTIERIMISVIGSLCLYALFLDFIKYEGTRTLGTLSAPTQESFKLYQFMFPAGYLLTFVFLSLYAIFTNKKIISLLSMIIQAVFSFYLLTLKFNTAETRSVLLKESASPLRATITKIRPMEGYSILLISFVLLLILLSIQILKLIKAQSKK